MRIQHSPSEACSARCSCATACLQEETKYPTRNVTCYARRDSWWAATQAKLTSMPKKRRHLRACSPATWLGDYGVVSERIQKTRVSADTGHEQKGASAEQLRARFPPESGSGRKGTKQASRALSLPLGRLCTDVTVGYCEQYMYNSSCYL